MKLSEGTQNASSALVAQLCKSPLSDADMISQIKQNEWTELLNIWWESCLSVQRGK